MAIKMQANFPYTKQGQKRCKKDFSVLGLCHQGRNSGNSNKRWLMRLQRLIMQFCILSLTFFLLTGCQDDSGGSSPPLSVTPESLIIAMGVSSRLTATLINSDVTSAATWSSSDTSVVTVSDLPSSVRNPKGTITAIRTGSATVTATHEGQTVSSVITVTSATLNSVQISPIYPSLALAATPEIQFTATGIFSDTTKLDLSEYVTWSSSDTAIGTVNNTAGKGGLVSTITAGSTTIKAVYKYASGDVTGDVSGDTSLTLTSDTVDSLEVTPINPNIVVGMTQQFAATVLVTDGTTKKTQDQTKDVVWSSGTIATAEISNATDSMGKSTALAAGTTNINSSFGAKSATASTMTVTAATLNKLQIFPPTPSIAIGVDFQLTAKGIYTDGTVYTHQNLTDSVVWSSSDTAVATICNLSVCKGKVTALSAGTTTITAITPGSITKTITLTVNGTGLTLTEIQVTPTNPSIYSGTSQKFTAIGIYTDDTTYFNEDITANVIWGSSNESVAIVSNAAGTEGVVKNRAAGTTTISATRIGIPGTSTLTVLAPAMALSSIEVSPANPSIADEMKQQFTAMGVFSDGTTTVLRDITNEVIWTSDTVAAARISNAPGSKGEAISVLTGASTITATLGAKSGTSVLTVFNVATYLFDSIEIAPETSTVTISPGSSQQLQATGIFKNGTDAKKVDLTNTVTWVSSDPTVVTVDNLDGTSGLLRGIGAGSTTITAYWTDIVPTTKSATKAVTVDSMVLQSMQVTPSNQSLDLAMSQQYQVLGVFSDGSSYVAHHLPPEVVWLSADISSSATINAPIENDNDNKGLVTTLTAGTSTISAKLGTFGATETLTTGDVTLSSITIYPANPTIGNGTRQQFKAYGTYSDNVNRDITHLVRWSSGTPATALIKNSPRESGLTTTVAAGSSILTATLGSVSGTATLTVKANTMVATGVQVTPTTPVMGAGTTLQLSATGIFTAGSSTSMDLTGLVYWTTSNAAVATVSNADDTNGRVYGVAAGTADFTAYWTGSLVASGTTTVTVTSGTVSSIEISPNQPSGQVGYTEQLNATALYSDNNTQNNTESVVWTSSDKSVVTVSNIEGSKGKMTRISVGSATITARLGASSATATAIVW
jgi:trimeric autotransporter adhesin